MLTDPKMVSPNWSPNWIHNCDSLPIVHKTIASDDETLAVRNMIDYIPRALLASDCIDRSLCHPVNELICCYMKGITIYGQLITLEINLFRRETVGLFYLCWILYEIQLKFVK